MKPLPGQLELPTMIDHKKKFEEFYVDSTKGKGIRLAELLVSYDSRPSSETWSRIQQLAAEILK